MTLESTSFFCAQRIHSSTDGSNLNIRSYPSTDASIIGKIPNGAAVSVYGQTSNWYVIRYNTTDGYAAADYITIEYTARLINRYDGTQIVRKAALTTYNIYKYVESIVKLNTKTITKGDILLW